MFCPADANADCLTPRFKHRLPYTPEIRVETHKHIAAQKEKDENKGKKKKEAKAPRKYFKEDGSAVNCNDAKVDFHLTEDIDANAFELDVHVFKVCAKKCMLHKLHDS